MQKKEPQKPPPEPPLFWTEISESVSRRFDFDKDGQLSVSPAYIYLYTFLFLLLLLLPLTETEDFGVLCNLDEDCG